MIELDMKDLLLKLLDKIIHVDFLSWEQKELLTDAFLESFPEEHKKKILELLKEYGV